jgi:hypothetical protein
MKYIFLLFFKFLFFVTVLQVVAVAEPIEDQIKNDAKKHWASLENKRAFNARKDWYSVEKNSLELKRNQYFLVSFTENILQIYLLSSLGQSNIKLTAIHVCDPDGGVTAFLGDPKITPSEQISKT